MPATNCRLCYPVWNHAHLNDPYMASFKKIGKTCAHDPEAEAKLIGSVFDMAHMRMLQDMRMPEARHGALVSAGMQR